jgi:hypothetical protein
MLLTACLAFTLYTFWAWHNTQRKTWLTLFYAGIVAAVYTKGPPGVVFPLLTAVVFYWGPPEDRCRLHLAWGLLAVIAAVSLWLIPALLAARPAAGAGGAGLSAGQVLFRHTIGRFLLGVSKAQWPWYYLATLPADLLPWSLFLPWVAPWIWKRRHEDARMRLLVSWTVPAFIFFSICIGKRAIYLLPLWPAMAILIARSVLDLMDSGRAAWRRRTAYVWAAILLVLAAGPVLLLLTEYRTAFSNYLLILTVAAAASSGDALFRAAKRDASALHVAMAVHFAALCLVSTILILPVVNAYKSAKPFCAPLRRLSEEGAAYRLYSVGFSREEYIFYSKHFHTPVLTDLIDVESTMPLREMAALQRELRDVMADAVADIPVASFDQVSDEEIRQLKQAVAEALDAADAPPGLGAAFERAMTREVRDFAAAFASDGPAFLFVQAEDWRWLIAIAPELRPWPVVHRRSIGSRDVLLVANTAGEALLELKSAPVVAAQSDG